MREAETLAAAGSRLLVVSQDTSAYGLDLNYRKEFWGSGLLKSRLPELADALVRWVSGSGCTTSIPIPASTS